MTHTLSQTLAGREPLVIGVLKGASLFVVEGFVVGYGLDFGDAYRHLDRLYLVDEA